MKEAVFFKNLSVLLDFLGMSILKCSESLGVFLLSLKEILVPLLVKLMILFDVCLLTFLLLLFLIENELLKFLIVMLLL